jgi:hypothetical protein
MLLYSPPSDQEIIGFFLPYVLMGLAFLSTVIFLILFLTSKGAKKRGFGILGLLFLVLFLLVYLMQDFLLG